MSADFWSGYASGAIGILVGNPLDLIKVRQQASGKPLVNPHFRSVSSLITGTAAPVLGYGALNAILFVAYHRSESALNNAFKTQHSLWATWMAGAMGGLAIWAVSTPTELIKCRAQISSPSPSSWEVTKQLWRVDGLKGLYLGGAVTALRDSIGYGFYFWAYEALNRSWPTSGDPITDSPSLLQEGPKIVVCGGLAGIATWLSVFPLDVIKTRVQTQVLAYSTENTRLLGHGRSHELRKVGASQAAREAYRQGGIRVFFAGLTVCSVRAFMVNAVQWTIYEWMMHKLGHGRLQRATPAGASDGVMKPSA